LKITEQKIWNGGEAQKHERSAPAQDKNGSENLLNTKVLEANFKQHETFS
jgi:hypothetical protein